MAPCPTVSVVVPSYQSAAHIAAAVESVLAQTLGDLEVVVVDDASTDGTADALRSLGDDRLRLLVNERRMGAAANWNRAIEQARGRFVKLLCGDDLLYPRCLEVQVAALDPHPGAVLAACRRDIVSASGRVLLRARGLAGMSGVVGGPEAIRRTVLSGTNALGEPAAVLLRRGVLRRCGPFRGGLAYVVDLDMWLRVLAHGDLVAVDETLCAFRVRPGSWSVQLARLQARQTRALFRQVRSRHGTAVAGWHEVVGGVRAGALAAGRRAAYGLWARQDAAVRERAR